MHATSKSWRKETPIFAAPNLHRLERRGTHFSSTCEMTRLHPDPAKAGSKFQFTDTLLPLPSFPSSFSSGGTEWNNASSIFVKKRDLLAPKLDLQLKTSSSGVDLLLWTWSNTASIESKFPKLLLQMQFGLSMDLAGCEVGKIGMSDSQSHSLTIALSCYSVSIMTSSTKKGLSLLEKLSISNLSSSQDEKGSPHRVKKLKEQQKLYFLTKMHHLGMMFHRKNWKKRRPLPSFCGQLTHCYQMTTQLVGIRSWRSH